MQDFRSSQSFTYVLKKNVNTELVSKNRELATLTIYALNLQIG